MTEKEYAVERAKLDVRDRESKLIDARADLDFGKRKLQCDVDKALADYKKANAEMLSKVAELTQMVKRSEIYLEMEQAVLKRNEDSLARGFDVDNT